MKMWKRRSLESLIAAVSLATTVCAAAQTYPSKPVRIVTAGAGTFHDIVTRQIAQRLTERWGQAVVVDNQPAAALTIGTGMVARASSDGYTLAMTDRSAVAVAPHLYKSLPYDVAKDFAPITLVALSPSLLVANPIVPADNLNEFLGYARSQPGGMHFASAGPGTNPHVAMELFKLATGTNISPVHYKGGGPSATAILSGEVKAGFGNVAVLLPHVKAGKLKAYLVTGTRRFPGAPQVPTAGEVGVQGLELEFWIGLVAPARTPPEIIAQVNRQVAEIMRSPEMQATLVTNGAYAAPGTPSEFATYISAESSKMKRLVELTGMRAE